jgi:hypothetical protein
MAQLHVVPCERDTRRPDALAWPAEHKRGGGVVPGHKYDAAATPPAPQPRPDVLGGALSEACPLSCGNGTSAAASPHPNNNPGLTGERHAPSRRAQNSSRPRRRPPSSRYWPNAANTPANRPRARRRFDAHAPALTVPASNAPLAFASIARARSNENGSAPRDTRRPIGCGEPGVNTERLPPRASPRRTRRRLQHELDHTALPARLRTQRSQQLPSRVHSLIPPQRQEPRLHRPQTRNPTHPATSQHRPARCLCRHTAERLLKRRADLRSGQAARHEQPASRPVFHRRHRQPDPRHTPHQRTRQTMRQRPQKRLQPRPRHLLPQPHLKPTTRPHQTMPTPHAARQPRHEHADDRAASATGAATRDSALKDKRKQLQKTDEAGQQRLWSI